MGLLYLVAILTLAYLVFSLIEYCIGFRQIKNLSQQKSLTHNTPLISIIVSALNEEQDIEQTIRSFLALSYEAFEIIAVDDRSTDGTGAILDRLQQDFPDRLHVFHLSRLPEGWLGKNHALQFGADKARGEWLLFTDADVLMSNDALAKTMNYALTEQLDHLTIFEHHLLQSFWLKVLFSFHYLTYTMSMRPWRIRYRWSKKSLGHGAFNLVKKRVYQQCGGHRAIALECLDDLKLGLLIKSHGYQQATINSNGKVARYWYRSLPEMIQGWKKNCFAYYEYRPLPVVRDTIFALVFYVWPVLALFVCSGTLQLLNGVNVGLTLMMSLYVAHHYRLAKPYALFYPVASLLLLYIVWNSMCITLKNRGIEWRGTFYSLKILRKKNLPLPLQVEGE